MRSRYLLPAYMECLKAVLTDGWYSRARYNDWSLSRGAPPISFPNIVTFLPRMEIVQFAFELVLCAFPILNEGFALCNLVVG